MEKEGSVDFGVGRHHWTCPFQFIPPPAPILYPCKHIPLGYSLSLFLLQKHTYTHLPSTIDHAQSQVMVFTRVIWRKKKI